MMITDSGTRQSPAISIRFSYISLSCSRLLHRISRLLNWRFFADTTLGRILINTERYESSPIAPYQSIQYKHSAGFFSHPEILGTFKSGYGDDRPGSVFDDRKRMFFDKRDF